jgi:hypothetical protein
MDHSLNLYLALDASADRLEAALIGFRFTTDPHFDDLSILYIRSKPTAESRLEALEEIGRRSIQLHAHGPLWTYHSATPAALVEAIWESFPIGPTRPSPPALNILKRPHHTADSILDIYALKYLVPGDYPELLSTALMQVHTLRMATCALTAA